MSKRRVPFFEITLVVVILILHAYAAFSDAYNLPNAWFTRDDAYYYFKVAENISEGRGITFDGINPTNGYHPLWLLVCIPIFALARFDLILPLRVLILLLAMLQAGTSVLIYRLLSRILAQPIAMLAATFWAFNLYIHYAIYELGLESALAAFTLAYLLFTLAKFDQAWRIKPVTSRQIALLAAMAALVMFSRLDLIFLVSLAGIWIIFRGHPMRFLLPFDILNIFIAMVSSYALRAGFPGYIKVADAAILSGILSILIKIPIFYYFGLYRHPRTFPILDQFLQIALAVAISEILLGVLLVGFQHAGLVTGISNSAPFLDFIVTLPLVIVLRLVAYRFGNPSTKSALLNLSNNPLVEFKLRCKTWLSEASIYYGFLYGSLVVYMIWNKLAFGSFTPVSGQIKRWWGSQLITIYEGPPRDWLSFFGLNIKTALNAWQPASDLFLRLTPYFYRIIPGSNTKDERYYLVMGLIVLLSLMLVILIPHRTLHAMTKIGLIPLVAGSGFQILSYTASGYAGYKEWYWISEMMLIVLIGSLLLDLLTKPLRNTKLGQLSLLAAAGITSLYLAIDLGRVVKVKMPYDQFASDRPYMELLPFLEGNTPPGSIIGMTGGGNVGYFIHDRTIVNMDGLINSIAYFHALQNGTAASYLEQKGMDIVFASPNLLALAPYNGQFAPYLERYEKYGGKDLLYLLPEPKY
jgi:hypothetical protein